MHGLCQKVKLACMSSLWLLHYGKIVLQVSGVVCRRLRKGPSELTCSIWLATSYPVSIDTWCGLSFNVEVCLCYVPVSVYSRFSGVGYCTERKLHNSALQSSTASAHRIERSHILKLPNMHDMGHVTRYMMVAACCLEGTTTVYNVELCRMFKARQQQYTLTTFDNVHSPHNTLD